MSTRISNHFWFFALLILPVQICLGQVPDHVTFTFDNSSALVWDLSGVLNLQQTMGTADVPLNYGVEVTHDGRGQLRGDGVTLVNVGNDFIAATYTVRGHVSGGGNSPVRAVFTVKLRGEDTVSGIFTPFRITVSYNLTANAAQSAFIGRARGSATFSNLSSSSINTDEARFSLGASTGAWTVDMNILPLKRLAGSATITLSSGRALPMHLSGSYSSRTALAKIKLAGINEAKGSSVNLNFISSEQGMEVDTLRGKILGQSVRE
jgi:hypothetical protein